VIAFTGFMWTLTSLRRVTGSRRQLTQRKTTDLVDQDTRSLSIVRGSVADPQLNFVAVCSGLELE